MKKMLPDTNRLFRTCKPIDRMKNRIRHIPLLMMAIVFLANCSKRTESPTAGKSFDSTLAIHINAIRNSNLAELDPTVADSVILISPMGERLHSKKSFMKLHENWFKKKNWEWEGTFVRTESTDSLGYALIQYSYTEKDSIDNITFRNKNYLVLIFRNSPKGWQLVHDQNTGIPIQKTEE
jgi:ketosteroid isomerase-like protein